MYCEGMFVCVCVIRENTQVVAVLLINFYFSVDHCLIIQPDCHPHFCQYHYAHAVSWISNLMPVSHWSRMLERKKETSITDITNW